MHARLAGLEASACGRPLVLQLSACCYYAYSLEQGQQSGGQRCLTGQRGSDARPNTRASPSPPISASGQALNQGWTASLPVQTITLLRKQSWNRGFFCVDNCDKMGRPNSYILESSVEETGLTFWNLKTEINSNNSS